MNIFFQTEEERTKTSQETNYKRIISEGVKKSIISLYEYSYLVGYLEDGGTVVGAEKFVNLINKFSDNELSIIISKMYSHIFDYVENKIQIKTDNLIDRIIIDKKEQIVFREGQLNAIKNIFNFLPQTDIRTYGLYGFAGSGKTTIIIQTITFLLKHKLIRSVVLSAPTNKAVNVMKDLFKGYLKEIYETYFVKEFDNSDNAIDKLYEIGIRIDFITIHKLLKFELDFGTSGEIMFIRSSTDSLISQYDIVIIDECSMIPIGIVDEIFLEVEAKDKFKKIPKIIFLGDPAQLPPVGEPHSMIFMKNIISSDNYVAKMIDSGISENVLRKKYNMLVKHIIDMPTTTLNEVMRSKSDSVKNVCLQIRLWTCGEIKFPDLAQYIDNKFVKAYELKPRVRKIKTNWFKKCLSYHKQGENCQIILTWTNKQVDQYNLTIRNTIFGSDNIERFMIGDILMLSDFHMLDSEKKDLLSDGVKFYTSEQIKVVGIEKINKKIDLFASQLSKSAMKLQNSKSYQNTYKNSIIELNDLLNKSYYCWKLSVVKLSNQKENMTKHIIYIIHEKDIEKYKKDNMLVANTISIMRQKLIIGFSNKKDQIDTHIIKPLWKSHHKILIEPFANVNYGYAITCHKAQGSNFYNVFVDMDDIIKNPNEAEAKHCLYTALTRTSNRLYLLLKK